MTEVETGNQPAFSGAPGADDLDGLRADLARMILNEAGRAVSQNPELPLSLTLVKAIERQAAQSAQTAAERLPTAQALSDAVLDAVGPELIRIARAAGTGDAVALARRKSQDGWQSRGLMLGAAAVLAGVLLFVAGFVTARLLPDKAAPVPPAAAAPAGEPSVAAGTETGTGAATTTSAPAAGSAAAPAATTAPATRPAR
jgi:hypothetical protein